MTSFQGKKFLGLLPQGDGVKRETRPDGSVMEFEGQYLLGEFRWSQNLTETF
jgi:hypothetical protein